jgi:DNA replication protein DnaC
MRRTTDYAERRIQKLVGLKYAVADFNNFTGQGISLREKLLNLKHDQDVFIYGPVGTGKTYTMAALLRYYVYEGFDCERINFDDFCVQIRATMSPEAKKTELDMIKPLKEIDKLFIDDLGLRGKQESDFAYVKLYTLLNKRQENMLPTYICSNKSIDQLGQSFDARIASRLSTALAIYLDGPDRRKGSSK